MTAGRAGCLYWLSNNQPRRLSDRHARGMVNCATVDWLQPWCARIDRVVISHPSPSPSPSRSVFATVIPTAAVVRRPSTGSRRFPCPPISSACRSVICAHPRPPASSASPFARSKSTVFTEPARAIRSSVVATGGLKRWLYRLVRKHAGRQRGGWRFDFRHLHVKSARPLAVQALRIRGVRHRAPPAPAGLPALGRTGERRARVASVRARPVTHRGLWTIGGTARAFGYQWARAIRNRKTDFPQAVQSLPSRLT
jgi:hypothetical protein